MGGLGPLGIPCRELSFPVRDCGVVLSDRSHGVPCEADESTRPRVKVSVTIWLVALPLLAVLCWFSSLGLFAASESGAVVIISRNSST